MRGKVGFDLAHCILLRMLATVTRYEVTGTLDASRRLPASHDFVQLRTITLEANLKALELLKLWDSEYETTTTLLPY